MIEIVWRLKTRIQLCRIKIQFSICCVSRLLPWNLHMWKMLMSRLKTRQHGACLMSHSASLCDPLWTASTVTLKRKTFLWNSNERKKKTEKKPFSSSRKTIIILIFSSHPVPTSQLLSSELTKLCARTFLSTMINLARGYLKSLASCLSASQLQQQCLPPGVHRCDCLVCSRYRDMSQKRGRTGILMPHLTEITSRTSVKTSHDKKYIRYRIYIIVQEV